MGPETRRTGTSRAQTQTAPHRRFFRESEEWAETGPWRPRSLYEGEPETCRRDLRHFLPVLAHLGLMLGVYKAFHIEGPAFRTMVGFALAALPAHYLLAYRWKRPAFVALSVVGMTWIFGVVTSLAVLSVAAVLIGICYLPARWGIRAGLVGAVALVCAALRPDSVATVVPSSLWPVLGTMFMFRMVIYLYELKHAKRPEPLADTLGYFFMLPNYCFLHFPVVDYRTMQRSYFSRDVHETQRVGLQMMFRGAIHLLLYRVIYHELLITPDEVRDPGTLALYLLGNYLLYLRVSGQFHTACGMLHLFGFHLPETHRNYLLATGFTDYWRRINIYWKDFMVRVVFNPVVFALKRKPQPLALAAATGVVFVTTWALHAYQSFWLRGEWGFSAPDLLFWGVLGALVLVNVQLDARRSNARPAKGAEPEAMPVPLRVARDVWVVGTVAALGVGAMATAWALSTSVSRLAFAEARTGFGASDAAFLACVATLVLMGYWPGARRVDPSRAKAKAEPNTPARVALRVTKTAWTLATIALLWSLWTSTGVGPWLAMLRRGMTI